MKFIDSTRNRLIKPQPKLEETSVVMPEANIEIDNISLQSDEDDISSESEQNTQ